MATIAYTSSGVGAGRTTNLKARADRVPKVVAGTFTFDSSYPTNGEDMSDVFGQFRSTPVIALDGSTVATKRCAIDYSTQKIKVFIEDGTSGISAEAGNGTDQSAVVVRFIAIGEM